MTGEEKGLQGSRYFAAHPTVDAKRLIADINLDMFLPLYPFRLVTTYGLKESDLGDTVRQVAQQMRLEVQDDPMPARDIFVRSDQYNFIRHGVPAVMIDVGNKKGSRRRRSSRNGCASGTMRRPTISSSRLTGRPRPISTDSP